MSSFHTKGLRYLVFSDVHLGNKNNTSKEIIENLKKFFEENDFSGLDFIFIAGDLFDSLLHMSDESILNIMLWLHDLFSYCSRNKIALRILEGTPSHDWKQSRLALFLDHCFKGKIDFKYVDAVSIEYNEKHKINILYVIDEASDSTKTTLELVKNNLIKMTLTKVDIAIMHGAFNYQLPEVTNKNIKHDEFEYLKIVKHFINIGHHHTSSVFDRIVAQGSFDRLRHGEEEKKGAYLMEIVGSERKATFIENKYAKTFKTINFKDQPMEKVFNRLEKLKDELRLGSFIRIITSNLSVLKEFNSLKSAFPFFNLTKESLEIVKNNDRCTLFDEVEIKEDNDLSEENIKNTLFRVVSNKYEMSDYSKELLRKVLV